MNTYKSFSTAMKTSSRNTHRRDCYCDNCCAKEAKRREGWNNTPSAKEQYAITTGKKR